MYFQRETWLMKNIFLLLCTLLIVLSVKAQQSQNITFIHEGKTVYGRFASPEGSGTFPTIILNPGTGANDRDGTINVAGGNFPCLYPGLLDQTLKPYKQLSEAMVDAGYAVLTYDKLEYTYTTASGLGAITFKKLWLPVNSAIDYVKTRSDVDTTNIILIGHSEGSTLIPYIAKSRNDIKALVSIAGPRAPLDSLLAYQLVYIAELCEGDLPYMQNQANQVLAYFDLIRTNTWNSSLPPLLGASPSVWSEYIPMADSVSINYNLAHLPTLFTGLGDDFNVPPSELTRFQNEVTITNDFWSIPDLNHFMTTATNPNISPVLTDTIIYWLGQHIWPTGVNSPEIEEFTFEVYPNPFSDEFVITAKNLDSKKWDVIVRNVVGQEIVRKQLNKGGNFEHSLSASSWANGIYFVSIQSDGKLITKKVVKQ